VQWSIIAESLDRSTHEKGRHGYGTLIRASHGARLSFHHNLWAHHQARMPRPGNYKDPTADPEGPLIDFRNNVFYNWGGDPEANHTKDGPLADTGRIDKLAAGYNADTNAVVTVNFVANAYKRGPDSRASLIFCEHDRAGRVFLAGNAMNGKVPVQRKLVTCNPPPAHRLTSPAPFAPVATDTAAVAYKRVLASAGASSPRDGVDARIVAEVRKGRGRIIDSEKSVGGWPVLRTRPAPKDTDDDGMPDEWERRYKLDPLDPTDGASPASDEGYTNLERYLNQLAR
jgi:hypothetical protein